MPELLQPELLKYRYNTDISSGRRDERLSYEHTCRPASRRSMPINRFLTETRQVIIANTISLCYRSSTSPHLQLAFGNARSASSIARRAILPF